MHDVTLCHKAQTPQIICLYKQAVLQQPLVLQLLHKRMAVAKMEMLLLLCSFAMINWVASQDNAADEVSQLQAAVRKLVDKVEHLENQLQSLESDPLSVYFRGKSHDVTKRDYTHSYNTYRGKGVYVFCGDDLVARRSVQKRSDYSHSYNDYDGNGTFVFCGGRSGQKSGVTYIAWGKQYCPNGQTLYSGVIGGNLVTHSAGGSNQLCLPDSPRYGQYTSGAQQRGLIFPGKYDTSSYAHQLSSVHGKLATCAACYNSGSSASLMIPAAVNCPSGWTQEYIGYLMAQPDVGGYYRLVMCSC